MVRLCDVSQVAGGCSQVVGLWQMQYSVPGHTVHTMKPNSVPTSAASTRAILSMRLLGTALWQQLALVLGSDYMQYNDPILSYAGGTCGQCRYQAVETRHWEETVVQIQVRRAPEPFLQDGCSSVTR